MNDEPFEELAALHAVGANAPSDLEALEARLARATVAERELNASLLDAAALAAITQTPLREPPASLKAGILGRIRSAGRKKQDEAAISHSAPPLAGFQFVMDANQGQWMPLKYPGAWVKLLSFNPVKGYAVVLGKLEPGAKYPAHRHINSEQIYILSGDLNIGATRLVAGDYHHADGGTEHGINHSETGCTILAVISEEDLHAQMA